jgi:hypothetical protein
LKKVTRSTRPAISSEGVRGCGEESFILVEVYLVEVYSAGADSRLSSVVPLLELILGDLSSSDVGRAAQYLFGK